MKKFLILFILILSGCIHYTKFNTEHNWYKSSFNKQDGIVAITLDKTQPYCSGIVLTPNLIVTAGHCTNPNLDGRLFITHGCHDISLKNCNHTPSWITVPHPAHKKNGFVWNDIGVIKPKNSITDIKPVTLALSIKTLSEIKLIGFGKRPNESGGILYAGKSKIKHMWLYGFQTYINGQNGPCPGDSGSPAFDTKGKVIGILSRSMRGSFNDCGGTAKYTIPFMYIKWLNNMNKILNNSNYEIKYE